MKRTEIIPPCQRYWTRTIKEHGGEKIKSNESESFLEQ